MNEITHTNNVKSARTVQIVPSVLPADFSKLGEECERLEAAGADRIQFDVMDGQFVPNLTFGPDTVASVRDNVSIPFEAHLMMNEPEYIVPRFIDAGCELIIVHAEACVHLHRTLATIIENGGKAGVALNPHTPLSQVANLVEMLDLLLVMTINPGFGGQKYLPITEPKIAEARALIDQKGLSTNLEVDGGISNATIAGPAKAGANFFISGSAIYNHPDGLEVAIKELRTTAAEAAAV